jgi:NCS1 family nucleobase:cation symporter-1
LNRVQGEDIGDANYETSTVTWYWFSDLVTAAGWSAASSVIELGLTSTDAILITLVAALCNAIPTVLNGSIGADLHIAFPIAIRASYGYWFSYFCVVTRGILALFW